MARPSKLTPDLQKELVKHLEMGCVVEDVCKFAGIDDSTYYLWQAIGKACVEDTPHPHKPRTHAAQARYIEFFDKITRAQAKARVTAAVALRNGMTASMTEEESVETFSETRLRKNKDGEEVPYTYTRTTTRTKTIRHPADWRAAIEYLKRRDPDNWSDRVKLDDWRTEAIRLIRERLVTYEAMQAELGQSLADELFALAGVPLGDAGAP